VIWLALFSLSGNLHPINKIKNTDSSQTAERENNANQITLIIDFAETIDSLRASDPILIETLFAHKHHLNLGSKSIDSVAVIRSVEKIRNTLSNSDPNNRDIYQFNYDLFKNDLETVYKQVNSKIRYQRFENEIFVTSDRRLYSFFRSIDLNVFHVQNTSQINSISDRFENPIYIFLKGESKLDWPGLPEKRGPFYINPETNGEGPNTYLDLIQHNINLLDSYSSRERNDTVKELKKIAFEQIIWVLAILVLLMLTGFILNRNK
jgi:hypothetical protein